MSPPSDYTVIYMSSAGNIHTKTVVTTYVNIDNLNANEDYSLSVIARNKYGPSDSSRPFIVTVLNCSESTFALNFSGLVWHVYWYHCCISGTGISTGVIVGVSVAAAAVVGGFLIVIICVRIYTQKQREKSMTYHCNFTLLFQTSFLMCR